MPIRTARTPLAPMIPPMTMPTAARLTGNGGDGPRRRDVVGFDADAKATTVGPASVGQAEFLLNTLHAFWFYPSPPTMLMPKVLSESVV